MKKGIILSAGVIILAAYVAISHAQGLEDTVKYRTCKLCGMNREEFASSRMLITYGGEKTAGTCSLRCAALDLALNMGRVPESIMVGDYNSRELTDAQKAYWVIGGRKEGVMSARGKWAFRKKTDAEGFRAGNGGRTGTFHEALRAAYEDLYKDLRTFWEGMKRQEGEDR